MALKPWYKVVTPREDLREGRPLDASEFAVHLDQVRNGQAPAVYQQPVDFFERTYLTKNLLALAAEVVRRLSGSKVETSAVFNMTTQFGGGKTHALTLLYHLAQGGPEASGWKGVQTLLQTAGVTEIPRVATAVFVGTEFDSIAGRGGADGTPVRKTPWGEIAWQLGGAEGLRVVAEHDASLTAPGGDVVARISAPGSARPDPARRANELREPQSQERPRRPAVQLPPQPVRGRPLARQRGARRLNPRIGARDDGRGPVRLRAPQEAPRTDWARR